MPGAFEALDLSEYEPRAVILVVLLQGRHHAAGRRAHLLLPHAHPLCVGLLLYLTAPTPTGWCAPLWPHQMHKLRVWDKCAADRVDYFIANSHYIAQRIKKYYRRDSDVIYPCCHINEAPFVEKEDFYLTVGRLTWYKRVDLAVAACTKLGKKLVVIGAGGEEAKLRALAGPTVTFLGGGLSDEEVRGYYLRAKAFCSPERKISASRRWRRSPPVRRCWPTAAAARAKPCCLARPATGSTRRPSRAWPPVSSGLSAMAWPTPKSRSATTAARSASSALRTNCAPTARRRMQDWQRELRDCSHWDKEEEV